MLRIAALCALAALAGCADADPAADGRAAESSAAADTMGAAVPPADGAAGWTVTAAGLGPLQAGMTTAEAATALGAPLPAVTSAECEMMRLPGAPGEAYVMIVADTVVRFDVRDPTIATSQGIRVGDSQTRVGELYPGVQVQPHKYTDGRYLVVSAPEDSTRRLVFETDSAAMVIAFRSGRTPEVQWVEGCS